MSDGYGEVTIGGGTSEPVRIEGPVVDDLSRFRPCHWTGEGTQGRLRDDCPHVCPCGKMADTFACKVRHIQLNTGWAKSAND